MSNTSSVTPYESPTPGPSVDAGACVGIAAGAVVAGVGLAAMCAVGAAKGVVSVAQWLNEENAVERNSRLAVQEERRRELMMRSDDKLVMKSDIISKATDSLQSRSQQIGGAIHSVTLSLRGTASLISAAESLGYQREPLTAAKESIAKGQSLVLLKSQTGERLAVERSARGRVMLHTAGSDKRIHTVVRKHTVDCAVKHLKKKGMSVQAALLPNGEVQLLAQETALAARSDGQASVTASVHDDGSAVIDIANLKSGRCKEIAKDLADAMGCRFIKTKEKSDAFQLPGEPTIIRNKV